MSAFWIALALVFVAELGDKTQLIILALGARYPASAVVTGLILGAGAINLISVLGGAAAGALLPLFWIRVVGGIAFIGFGIWTLRGENDDEHDAGPKKRLGPVATVALTFFVAEFGDKTMLLTLTIASQHDAFVLVWAGATLGMVASDLLAVAAGKLLGGRMPERAIRIGAAIVFIASGVFTLWQAFAGQGS